MSRFKRERVEIANQIPNLKESLQVGRKVVWIYQLFHHKDDRDWKCKKDLPTGIISELSFREGELVAKFTDQFSVTQGISWWALRLVDCRKSKCI